MVHCKPCLWILSIGPKGDMPGWLSLRRTGCIIPEVEVGDTLFVRDQLTIPPGGQGLIPQDTPKGGEMLDQAAKLPGIMPPP